MAVVLNREERQQLNQELFDEVTGLGPLEPLLKDDTINDILVNGPQQVFVERAGKLTLTDTTFKDERHLLRIIDKIVSAVGRRVDESNPYVDARLADGSRFNAMVPPIAVDGSLVSIRKFKKEKLAIDDLVRFGAFSEEMAAYLQAAVATRLNIIVSAARVRARRPRSTRCRPSSTTPSASSRSRIRRNSSSSRRMWAGWKAARRTSRARAPSPSGTA
jgi:pilus assembly protein CpaF